LLIVVLGGLFQRCHIPNYVLFGDETLEISLRREKNIPDALPKLAQLLERVCED
jgi:hypothetical protein